MELDSVLELESNEQLKRLRQLIPSFFDSPELLERAFERTLTSEHANVRLYAFEMLARSLSQLDKQTKCIMSCKFVQTVISALSDSDPQLVKLAIRNLGPMIAIFFDQALVNPQFVPTFDAMKRIRDSLVSLLTQENLHLAIQIELIKFIQTMCLLFSHSSTDLCISRIPKNHEHLKPSILADEGSYLVNQLISVVSMPFGTISRITCTIFLLAQFARCRPKFLPMIATAMLAWPANPEVFARFTNKIHHLSIQRLLKVSYIVLSRQPIESDALFERLIDAAISLGARAQELPRTRRDPTVLQALEDAYQVRKAVAKVIQEKIDLATLSTENMVEIILQSLFLVSSDDIEYSISRYQAEEKKNYVEVVSKPPKKQVSLPNIEETHILDVFLRILKGEDYLTDDTLLFQRRPLVQNLRRTRWINLVTRIIAKLYDSEKVGNQLRQMFADFVCSDFRNRFEYAVQWLHQESNQETIDTWFLAVFDRIFGDLLTSASSGADSRALMRFVVESPRVPWIKVIDRLKDFMSDTEKPKTRVTVCAVLLLKEIVEFCPKFRIPAIELLFLVCRSPLRELREPAIIALKQCYAENTVLAPIVLEEALQSLKSGIRERLDLMFALCMRSPALFSHVFKQYTVAESQEQQVLRTHIALVVKAIGMNDDLRDAIENCERGAESLALRILLVLTERNEPPSDWVEMVCRMHSSRSLNGKFLLPVLGKLDRERVHENLVQLVSLISDAEQNKKVWKDVLVRICSGTEPRFAPESFFYELNMLDSKADLRKLVLATQICIESDEIFTQNDIAKALDKLVKAPVLPKIIMRSILLALKKYPVLVQFGKKLLIKLTQRQIWLESQVLWEGYLRVLHATLPFSIAVVFSLPFDQAKSALARVPTLKDQIKEFISSKRLHTQPRVLALMPLLIA